MKTTGARAAAFLVLLVAGTAAGGIIHVPDDYPSIKTAVAAASESDTVLVAAGIYSGPDNRAITIADRHFVLLSEAGPEDTIIDGEGASYAFMLSGIPSTAVLEGFTVRNCSHTSGGAIHFGNDVNLTIKGCHFRGNAAQERGGAIYSASGTSATFLGCVFEQNEADGGGGAVYVAEWGGTEVVFDICEFKDNVGGCGGAIYCDSLAGMSLVDCTFSGNVAEGLGGAVVCGDFGTAVSARRCWFAGNQAGLMGGALYAYFGRIYLDDCHLVDNGAGDSGGAVCSFDTMEAYGCTFAHNYAGSEGGALWLLGDVSGVLIASSTLVGNASPLGGGIRFTGFGYSPQITDVVIAFSSEGCAVSHERGAGIQLTCCDLYGNAGGDWTGVIADQLGQNGNISEDPLFCMETSSLSPWTLQSDSPCAPEHSGGCGLIGAWPVDCAPTPVEPSSWGRIKALYT